MLRTNRSQTAASLVALLCAASLCPAIAAESAAQTDKAAATKTAPATTNTINPAATSALPTSPVNTEDSAPPEKLLWKPGQELSTETGAEDIVPTWDIPLAQKQVAKFSDSPEASFILAIALTRTSRVEEALKEVQRARKLAEAQGGPAYFDKMIATYEHMLKGYPDDNRVRYGLAWAYYMKSYLLSRHSRKTVKWKLANPQLAAQMNGGKAAAPAAPAAPANNANKDVVKALQSNDLGSALAGLGSVAAQVASGKTDNLPKLPSAFEGVDSADIPQIRKYYELAIKNIDDILQRDPNDVWSLLYGAHLRAEYTGNLDASMKVWRAVAEKNPNNPGPYFFLGEGYLKQGNLKESINHVSKAIALRALGN